MAAYKTWKTYGSAPRVDPLISQAKRDEIQRHNEELEVRQNREMLKNLTQAVLYLSRQELSFRGHDEFNNSLNRGNYRELLVNVLPEWILFLKGSYMVGLPNRA